MAFQAYDGLYGIGRKILNFRSREAEPEAPTQCHDKPRTGRGNNRAMQPR